MSSPIRRRVKALLLGLGLYAAAWRVIGWARRLDPRVGWRNGRLRRSGAPDGLPLPPPRLAYAVSASYDLQYFLDSGRIGRESIESLLSDSGAPFASFRRILDFGCGCGRMIRQWAGYNGVELHGCDYNGELVGWCRENLRLARFALNASDPPLPYESAVFDLVYCLSVFTHLTEPQQSAWMAELRRILSPRGYLLLTTQSEYHVGALDPRERRLYDEGGIVVRSGQSPGSNLCETYHSPAYVRERLSKGFEVLAHRPAGQDLWLLRKL